MTQDLTPAEAAAITNAVDISAPPPPGQPVALVLFGSNQYGPPVRLAADRYRQGLAPLIIATGGANRHDGTTEGRELAMRLEAEGVPSDVIRVEDQARNTWQNVELSLPYLREAVDAGLPLTAVSKWFHLRTVYILHTLLPDSSPLHAIGWEPVYGGETVTRDNWPRIPDGRRRVLRESQEVPSRIAAGDYLPMTKKNGAWLLRSEVRVPTRADAPLASQAAEHRQAPVG